MEQGCKQHNQEMILRYNLEDPDASSNAYNAIHGSKFYYALWEIGQLIRKLYNGKDYRMDGYYEDKATWTMDKVIESITEEIREIINSSGARDC